MIAGAGRASVCILSQHSILEYFSSFLCILLGIACNNVEYQISPVGWKVEETTSTDGLFLKQPGKSYKFGFNAITILFYSRLNVSFDE